MSDVTTIESLVRYMIEDYSTSMVPGDIFVYTTSNVFTLTEANVLSVSVVLKNDVELDSGEYTYNASRNQLTVSASLNSGDTVEIQYSYYPNYSASEIENYIRAAVVHLSVNNYYTFELATDDNFYPEITNAEKNLVAFIAATLIKPDNRSYRLPDISVSVPKSLPTRDLISKAVAIFKHNTHGNFDIIGP